MYTTLDKPKVPDPGVYKVCMVWYTNTHYKNLTFWPKNTKTII